MVLALKSGNEFAVFKSLSVCLFQILGRRDDIANLVTLSKIFGSLKFIHCRIIVFYNFEFILKGFWY